MKRKLLEQLVKLRLEHYGDKLWCNLHGLSPDLAQRTRITISAHCWSDNRMSWWYGVKAIPQHEDIDRHEVPD